MHQATIEVQYVNEPKEGKKMGSIKSKEGEYYAVWPDKLANFKPGNIYTVNYTEDEFKGKTYKTIKGAEQANATPYAAGIGNQLAEMASMGLINRRYEGSWNEPLDPVILQNEYYMAMQAFTKALQQLKEEPPF